MSHVEIITWYRPEDNLPPNRTIVLTIREFSNDIWPGFIDSGTWELFNCCDGCDTVTYWAHMPKGPWRP